jgi:hypothetical protein
MTSNSMDDKTREKVEEIYNNFLKDDPNFQRFYQSVSHSNQEYSRGPELRRGTQNQAIRPDEVKVTPEAQKFATKDVQPTVKVEKERSLYDLIMSPRDREEQIISAAARSGLVTQADEKDLKSHEASVSNVKAFVTVIGQRAHTVHMSRVWERERKQHQQEEAAEKSKGSKKEHSVLPKFDYGVLDEIQRVLKEAVINDRDVASGPQSTPKEARDAAQKDRGSFHTPTHENK